MTENKNDKYAFNLIDICYYFDYDVISQNKAENEFKYFK